MKCPHCDKEILICPHCWSPIEYDRKQMLKDGKGKYYDCPECQRKVRVTTPKIR